MTVTSAAVAPRPIRDRPVTEPVVHIRGLTKRFRLARTWRESLFSPRGGSWVTVVDDVHLDVRRGEFFGLLGPNGAGKTTLFKILSTLVLPDEGSATVEGLDIVRNASRIRDVLAPVIPEERSVNWRLSARENLVMYAALHGLRGTSLHRRVDELLAAVELDDSGHKMVGRFSSGMKQRLLLARTLLGQPSVLLLDEPTRSLDPISARRFRSFLREEIAARQGCTVLLATHNAEEALELCDRVGVLNRGRLLAEGTTESLARRTGDPRYRLVTRTPIPAALDRVLTAARATTLEMSAPDPDGWITLITTVPGGKEEVSRLIADLGAASVPVAGFERVPQTLADLIETIVKGEGGDGGAL
jgi:ABC-2 type transport system ATP-binding protein